MANVRNIHQPIPLTEPLLLGEGPHWDDVKQLLFFVDMDSSKVHSYDPASGKHHCAKVDGEDAVGTIIPVANEMDKYVISYGGDLDIISWDGRSSPSHELHRTRYLTLESNPRVRINDCRASPSGILFAGSMARRLNNGSIPPGKGNLFVVENNLSKNLISNLDISNGLGWNKAETEFYLNDTLPRKVYKFGYDAASRSLGINGPLDDYVLLDYEKSNLKGSPDGMTVDADGFLWIASVDGGGEVIRVDPHDGTVLLKIPIPNVSAPSSVAFGGPAYEDLYVTTIQTKGEPNSGRLFKISNIGAKGRPGVRVIL